MKNPWDRIVTSAPMDKQAAIVRDSKGEHFTPQLGRLAETKVRTIAPPPIRPNPKNAEDLTGARIGRLTVIGRSASGPAWVVRCSCGWYEHRKARVLKSSDPDHVTNHMCDECRYVEEIKTGKPPPPKERMAIAEARRALKAAKRSLK